MTHNASDDMKHRRTFFKRVAIIPIAAAGGTGALLSASPTPTAAAPEPTSASPYVFSFFSKDEQAFLTAACNRLIPADEHGPGAVELGALELLDRHMQTPYTTGGIWYMQGPFLDASASFGYQGRLVLRDILREGIKAMDAHSKTQFDGKVFAGLSPSQQDQMLKDVEGGKIEFEAVPAKVFFSSLLGEVRNGYFSDPKHGGNKDMGSWKMIGYPGMRADYIDWVSVRDKPYPIGPVDLAGRRG